MCCPPCETSAATARPPSAESVLAAAPELGQALLRLLAEAGAGEEQEAGEG